MGIFFVSTERVNAARLNWDGVTVECIYSDGGLYESSYNDYIEPNGRVVNRYTYNLKGVDSDETGTNSSFNYVDATGYITTYSENHNNKYQTSSSPLKEGKDNHLQCNNYLYVGINREKNEDGDKVPVTYAAFGDVPIISFQVPKPNPGWLSKLFGINESVILEATTYKLVSENYVLTEKSGSPRNVLSYKRQNDDGDQQAVSDPKYVHFLVYDNAVLVQGPNKINYIDVKNYNISNIEFDHSTGELKRGTPTEALTLSDPEPKAYVGNGSNVFYSFDSVRYSFDESGQRYVFSGTTEEGDPIDNGDLCKKIMPNTAKIIAKVIGWCQLLVPALLIVLVALDLSKLMLAGNIEEELPKQRKRIVVRFIAAVTVFFLPFIVKLALSNVKTSGSSIDEISSIEYIDCIFEMIGTS